LYLLMLVVLTVPMALLAFVPAVFFLPVRRALAADASGSRKRVGGAGMKRAAFVWVGVAQMLVAACGAASNTDLFDAVRAGDAEKIKTLLQADPKLAEVRTEDGSTALHLAALEGQAAVARLLLTNGAQVNARGLREETPLHMAMYDGHREVVEVLLASGADVNARNKAGETPLHLAAGKGYLGLVELLLSQNADTGARDNSGRTPKMAATEREHWELVELLTPRVGDYYDVHRFVFEGAKTFPPEALRQVLRRTRDFFDVSNPLAPQDTYLETIQRRLLLGYHHCGFPEARIEARVDARAGRVVVTVEEGPRYVCGGIKVSGAKEVPATVILERLTTTNAPTGAVERAFDFQDKAPATNPLTQALADQADSEEALWVEGNPAGFSNPDLLGIKEGVTGLLAEHGYLFPKLNVQVVPDKATGKAELQVEVLEEGPRAVIERVDVVGNKTNTAEAVVRYLDLKPGMELSRQLVSKIEDRLWRAARFLGYKVSLGSPSDGGRVPLQIEVAEYSAAPPLAQAFSPAEAAMLKMREWLSKLDENGDDMVVQLTDLPAPTTEGELVMSPRSGVALLVKDVTRKTEPREEYAFMLKAGQAGLYSPTGGRKLLLACPGTQLWGFLIVDTTPGAVSGSPFHISVGAGFKGNSEGMPAGPTYRFQLAVPPVACIGFAHQGDYSCWFDGDMLIRSNASSVVKLNARTGRIIEYRSAKELGDASAQIRFEAGTLARAFDHIATATAGMPDLADTNAPLSSTLAFLAEEVWSSKYLRGASHTNQTAEAAALLSTLSRQFRLANLLAPLDRMVGETNGLTGKHEGFAIPYDEGSSKGMHLDTMAMISTLVLLNSDELFEARTWPWTLLREACLTVQGKGGHTEEALKGIYESKDTGPLGYLATAGLLGRFQPPWARKFAARGLERLSAADFLRDCRLFLEGNSIANQCCLRLAAATRELDDEQLASLAMRQSPARGEFMRECSRRLRAAKDQPALEALAPTLASYWEQELKEQVATALRAQTFDPVKAFEEGLAAFQAESPDKSQAAKLFREAATRGHAGAQYYLAMIYERGMGVPKDVAAALDWYRQSATNGCAEAAVVLGNYYHDGLEVKQDYAEAFVWYSVAGAQGHKVAQAFRKSAKDKLTAQQLTEAQERVEAILANRPKGGDTPAASSTDH
jgi:TPR repeat protein